MQGDDFTLAAVQLGDRLANLAVTVSREDSISITNRRGWMPPGIFVRPTFSGSMRSAPDLQHLSRQSRR